MSPQTPEPTCQQLVELVTDYFESALGPTDRARFEAHVAGCRGCEAYLGQMRATLEVVGATAALETRPEVSALLEAFRDWKLIGRRTPPDAPATNGMR